MLEGEIEEKGGTKGRKKEGGVERRRGWEGDRETKKERGQSRIAGEKAEKGKRKQL